MKKRPLCFVCLFILLFQGIQLWLTSGQTLINMPASSVFRDGTQREVYVQGQVYQKVNTSNYQILYLKNNSIYDQNNSYYDSKILIYDESFSEIPIGKVVYLKGRATVFDTAHNQGNYDQALFYAKQEIYGCVWAEQVLKETGEANLFQETLYRIKCKWKAMLIDAIGEQQGAVLSAMLLAEKSEMDAEVKELYQKNGIGHVLAISGLHISFIGLGIYKLVRRTGLSYIVSGILSMVILTAYVCMIGFSVSVVRAYIMLLLKIGADMSGRVYDMVTGLALSATIWIVYQPLYLTDAGFYMSYGAVLGIVLILPALQKIITWKWMSGLLASLSIHIMLFPILLWYYFEIPTYSMLWNLFVIPLMSYVLGLGMLGSLCQLLCQPLGYFILKGCYWILELFEMMSRMGSNFPMARLVLGQPKIWELLFYYIVLCSLLLFIHYCKDVAVLKRSRRYLGILLLLPIVFIMYQPKGKLLITMLDVGQGDAIFLEGPEGNTYLIDGGSSDVTQLGKYRIEPYLKSQGVGRLDYVFISHGDTDHYAGVEEMLGRQALGVRICNLVFPVNYQQDEALIKLAILAKSVDTNVLVIKEGMNLSEGKLQITCIQPGKEEMTLTGNAGSMVLEVRFCEFEMLCTGDVEAEGEERLLTHIKEKDYDVLKVAHHGSKNSTSQTFLEEAEAKIALISAGKDNSYGHPHPETLERLKEAGCSVYKTTDSGAVTLETDGKTVTVSVFH